VGGLKVQWEKRRILFALACDRPAFRRVLNVAASDSPFNGVIIPVYEHICHCLSQLSAIQLPRCFGNVWPALWPGKQWQTASRASSDRPQEINPGDIAFLTEVEAQFVPQLQYFVTLSSTPFRDPFSAKADTRNRCVMHRSATPAFPTATAVANPRRPAQGLHSGQPSSRPSAPARRRPPDFCRRVRTATTPDARAHTKHLHNASRPHPRPKSRHRWPTPRRVSHGGLRRLPSTPKNANT
jgi:hypothetical protein